MDDNLKVFTAFSGYDSQCMALDRLGVDYELVGWSEIDKYAIKAHNAIYPQWNNRNYGDITNIDWGLVPSFDLFTYSFPCTDISTAGKQMGLDRDSGTRSSLLWECERAIQIKKPKYLLMENVKALVNKRNIKEFEEWQNVLESFGYSNFTKILNAKDYGIPQNRERVFMISIFGDGCYNFPNPIGCNKLLFDILQVYKGSYITNSINKRLIKLMESTDIEIGDWIDAYNQSISKYAGTITTRISASNLWYVKTDGGIRKLTPSECFRLMGVDEYYINRLVNSGINNGQLYKLAGNSIVVDVLYYIFRNLLKPTD